MFSCRYLPIGTCFAISPSRFSRPTFLIILKLSNKRIDSGGGGKRSGAVDDGGGAILAQGATIVVQGDDWYWFSACV